jgi:predicted MPP superfamily phosphohydrolase
MIWPRLFLCSGVSLPANDPHRAGRHAVELATQGGDANVHIRLMDLARVFDRHLSPRLEDALEIAAYVYAADCATQRGGAWADDDTTEPWKRDMRFVIPVRDLPFWNRPDVMQMLAQTLRFLSDDTFCFEFRQDTRVNVRQAYLEFGKNEEWPFHSIDRVLMFSGGLDSLAGAAETAAAGGKLVLVSHRPVSTQSSRQQRLFELVRTTWGVPMIHVPVWINKDEKLGKEPTQRTRSFLYATLGAVVAASVKAAGVRFFENGVVSLNLPVADEVVGARASRTTHPHALHLFSRLFGLILGREFTVDNPYLFKTKKEVVEVLAANRGCPLIGYTCSCAHQGIFQSRTRWHCGTCSQCIDRRIAIVAAGLAEHEPAEDYVCDVFTGRRGEPEERNMAVNYARHGMELARMGEEEMAARFNQQFTRAVRDMTRQAEAARRLVEMHRRHGETVVSVLQQQVEAHARQLVDTSLEPTSMLALVAARSHQRVTAVRESVSEGMRVGVSDTASVTERGGQMRTHFGWLHLTDLHFGMSGQKWLWPNIREEFYSDLEKLHRKAGPWDLVLFTGDFVQKGGADEFQKLNELLGGLWERLRGLGSTPFLLGVPGNHDLVRPRPADPAVAALRTGWGDPHVQQEFWTKQKSSYQKAVRKAFKNYMAWWDTHTLPRLDSQRKGLLPGDFSATLEKDGVKFGVVGLNTTFLQLEAGDYEGRLALSPQQFHQACGGDGAVWVRDHQVCLLLTHQPTSWLMPDSRQQLSGEIAVPGRFAAHLFGHMHEPAAHTLAQGGADARREWQGCSLFGLEDWGEDGKKQRLHGYSAGRVELTRGNGSIRMWPRRAEQQQAGHRHIVADHSYTLEEDEGTRPEPVLVVPSLTS